MARDEGRAIRTDGREEKKDVDASLEYAYAKLA
jgi:hypothetical protein